MNNFVELMHKIYEEFLKLIKDPKNDTIYNNLKNDLRELDNLLENYLIPSDVYVKVQDFYTKVYRKVSYLRPEHKRKN